MVIGVNCGHTISGAGYGAVGIVKESEQTRLVGRKLMELLRSAGVGVIDCTIDSANSQKEYLAAAVALANRQDLDWFISIHLNASSLHTGQGVEVYTYAGNKYQDAVDVCNAIAELGFVNRGVKSGSGLYVINRTKAKSMLIECCFCDNVSDMQIYNEIGGADAIAKAIYKGIYKEAILPDSISAVENHNMSNEEFIDFVGNIAREDWNDRHIMIPSIVVAQAIKESGWGTSELAQNANAIFGIKKNDWTGKVYIKNATEQRTDGTYYNESNTEWRAYDSWEQSIIDHNNYIATRSTDGEKSLRYAPVIGCEDYVLCTQYLQQCGYATSLTYAESLINIIERYDLIRFDKPLEDEIAPEGSLYIVQAGAYRSKNNAKKLVKKLEKMGVISLIRLYSVSDNFTE